MNRQEALLNVAFNDGGYLATIMTAQGKELCYAAQSQIEAQRWVNFNRAYMVPGSDKLEHFANSMAAEAELD